MRTEIILKEKQDSAKGKELLEKRYREYDEQFLANLKKVGRVYFERMKLKLEEIGMTLHNRTLAIDIGCGPGTSLLHLSREFEYVYGTDISLSYLVLARKLLEENGIKNVNLFCGNAEDLPFPDGYFIYGQALQVIEHVKTQRSFVTECARVIRDSGLFFLSSPNRFSLLREPHSRIPCFGFLPKRLALSISALLPGDPMSDVTLISFGGLQSLLRTGFSEVFIYLLSPGVEFAEYRGIKKIIKRWTEGNWTYKFLDKIFNSPAILRISPIHFALCRK